MNFSSTFNSLYHKTMGRHLFLSSFIILWIFYMVLYPSFSYDSQLYFEQGSNYLYHAYNYNLRTNVWTPDAGYLVWLPRAIALIVSIFASPHYFVYITNILALAMIAFFVSFINHQGFRSFIANDHLRFALGLLFGAVILPVYEVFSYINFAYTGFIFIAFLLFLNKEKVPQLEYASYMVLCALLSVSKFHFVVFFPFFLAAMVWHWCKKEYKSMWFYLPSLMTIGIQILYVLAKSSKSTFVVNHTVYDTNLFQVIFQACRGFGFWTTAYATNFRFLGNAVLAQLVGLAFFSFLFYLLIKAYQAGKISKKIMWMFIIFNLISIGFGCMTSLSSLTEIGDAFFNNGRYPLNRRGFVSYDMVWFSVVILLLQLCRVYTCKSCECTLPSRAKFGIPDLPGLLLMIFILLSGLITFPKAYTKAWYSWINPAPLSDWRHLHSLFLQDYYYIPVDPSPFGLYAGVYSKGTDLGKIAVNPYLLETANKIEANIPKYDRTSFQADGTLTTMDLYAQQAKVLSMIIECAVDDAVYAQAYSIDGQVLTQTTLLSQPDSVYKYLLFQDNVVPARIAFFYHDGQTLSEVKMAAIYILTEE